MIEISELLTTEEVAKIFKLKEKNSVRMGKTWGKFPVLKLFTETRIQKGGD